MPASTSAFRMWAWALAALRLDRVAAGLLHEARGVGERALDGVVALVGHAAEHERVGRAAPDGLGVHHHHVHGGGDGGGVTVRDHGQAVAHHGHVDARHLGPFGARVVRHRHVDHLLAGLLGVADLGDGALLALLLRRLGVPCHDQLLPQAKSVTVVSPRPIPRPAKFSKAQRPLTKRSGKGWSSSGAISTMSPPPITAA